MRAGASVLALSILKGNPMANVKVKLLRPLDGVEVGKTVEYPEADAKRLAEYGAVELVGKAAAPPSTKMEPAPLNKAAPKAKGRK